MKETLTWLTSYPEARFVSSPFSISVIHTLKLHLNIELNPVILISVYATARLYRQTFCVTNKLLTVNHNVTLVGCNNTTTTQIHIFIMLEPSSTACVCVCVCIYIYIHTHTYTRGVIKNTLNV